MKARPDPLRFFSQVISGVSDIEGRGFVRALFQKCNITRLRNTTLTRCTMEDCTLDPADIRDILGITLTLNCQTFDRWALSPLTLDAIIYLISRGSGEDQKKRVRAVIPPERVKLFDRIFPLLELGVPNDGMDP